MITLMMSVLLINKINQIINKSKFQILIHKLGLLQKRSLNIDTIRTSYV